MTQTNWKLYKSNSFQDLLRKSADYYSKTANLQIAGEFLFAVETAIKEILKYPSIGPRYIPPEEFDELKNLHYRLLSLRRFSPFPYSIFYEIKSNQIILQTILHHSQNREKILTQVENKE